MRSLEIFANELKLLDWLCICPCSRFSPEQSLSHYLQLRQADINHVNKVEFVYKTDIEVKL